MAEPDTQGTTTTIEAVDGRTARAQRTREAVVDAVLTLIEEGELRPRAGQIADEAGVSLRSVFQHFSDMDSLFAEATMRHVARNSDLYTAIPSAGSLDERIDLLVARQCRRWETVAPVRRAGALHVPFSESLQQMYVIGHDLHRAELAHLFAVEISTAGGDGDALLDWLDLLTSWRTWESMRAELGLAPEDAASRLHGLLSGLFSRVAS